MAFLSIIFGIFTADSAIPLERGYPGLDVCSKLQVFEKLLNSLKLVNCSSLLLIIILGIPCCGE